MTHLITDPNHIASVVEGRGFTEHQARRRVEAADKLYNCADALDRAVAGVREFYVETLDGLHGVPDDVNGDEELARLESAWREFRETVAEAQRIEVEA